MNFVYLTTNLLNGKQYVGSHEGYENDSYLGRGTYISRAVKKYGKENFKREILEVCDSSINLILEDNQNKLEYEILTRRINSLL